MFYLSRILAPIGLAILCAAGASAAPLACGSGTIGDYVALGSTGCLIEDKLFSDFIFLPSSDGVGVTPLDTDISVTPLTSPFTNLGLLFTSSAWTINGIGNVYSSISFNVSVVSGPFLIDGASLSLTGGSTLNVASAGVGEQVCPGILPCLTMNTSPLSPTDQISFAPQLSVSVVKEIQVVGTQMDSQASITSFEERFSQVDASSVPEPSTFVLLGTAIAGLGWLRRKR